MIAMIENSELVETTSWRYVLLPRPFRDREQFPQKSLELWGPNLNSGSTDIVLSFNKEYTKWRRVRP